MTETQPLMMMQTCPANAVEHPATFAMFCDAGSIAHLGLGFFADTLDPRAALTLFVAFAAYQVSQAQTGESWTRTAGEFLEFGLGMLLAQFVDSP